MLSLPVQSIVKSELVEAFGQRRLSQKMSKLRNHFIVCGAGRVGSQLVQYESTIRSALDVVIVSILRANGDVLFNPAGHAQIAAGDVLIAIGKPPSLMLLSDLTKMQGAASPA